MCVFSLFEWSFCGANEMNYNLLALTLVLYTLFTCRHSPCSGHMGLLLQLHLGSLFALFAFFVFLLFLLCS